MGLRLFRRAAAPTTQAQQRRFEPLGVPFRVRPRSNTPTEIRSLPSYKWLLATQPKGLPGTLYLLDICYRKTTF